MANRFEITYNPREDAGGIREEECIATISLEAQTPKEALEHIITSAAPRNPQSNPEDRLFMEIKNGNIKRIRKL